MTVCYAIIQKILSQNPGAGILCDFTNVEVICSIVPKAVALKNEKCTNRMRAAYREVYNYGCYAEQLKRFVCNVKVGGTK